jgi:hypothetical protein
MSYVEKYLKYKAKYLQLKANIGGAPKYSQDANAAVASEGDVSVTFYPSGMAGRKGVVPLLLFKFNGKDIEYNLPTIRAGSTVPQAVEDLNKVSVETFGPKDAAEVAAFKPLINHLYTKTRMYESANSKAYREGIIARLIKDPRFK